MLRPWTNARTLEGLAIREAHYQQWVHKCSQLPDGTWPIYVLPVNGTEYCWRAITVLGGEISAPALDNIRGLKILYTHRYITVQGYINNFGCVACYLSLKNPAWDERWRDDRDVTIFIDGSSFITCASFLNGSRIDSFLLYFLNDYEIIGDMEDRIFRSASGFEIPWYRITAIQPLSEHPSYHEQGWAETVQWS
jgi:hypothetical protein